MAFHLPPPPTPTSPLAHLEELWNPSKAWAYLRAGHPGLRAPGMQSRLARYAFAHLGVKPEEADATWHGRVAPEWDVFDAPLPRLPVHPEQPWPEQAGALEGTAAGVLAVLVANGLDAFGSFVGTSSAVARRRHRVWPVELLMGRVGSSRLPGLWRAALIDQFLRAPSCPPRSELLAPRLRATRKLPELTWMAACARYQEWPTLRVLLDHGFPTRLPGGECISTLCPQPAVAARLSEYLLSRRLPAPTATAPRPRV